MTLSWGTMLRPKYLTIQRCEWDMGDYKPISFSKVPLGWAFNVGRLSISYDNHGKVVRK